MKNYMTKLYEVYKCEKCGSIFVVFVPSVDTPECCNTAMVLIPEKTMDQLKEKHVPVIEQVEGGILVKVGEVPHPMEEKHYIMWIEVHIGEYYFIKRLSPGEKPEAEFRCTGTNVNAREYCNIHGLWSRY